MLYIRPLLAAVLVALSASCGSGIGSTTATNVQVVFHTPAEGESLWEPAVIAVSGEGIVNVEFLLDDQLQFLDETAPFEWTLSPESFALGIHVLGIRVETVLGEERNSVEVTLVPGPPTLTGVEPAHGPLAGGTRLTLTGTNLTSDATVLVDGNAASEVFVVPYETVSCTTPPAVFAGVVDIEVTTPRGTTTLADAFTYDADDAPPPVGEVFPLSVHSGGRYLVQADGKPFLLPGDAPWSIAVQLTESQVDTYLDDREWKGFNAILFNLIDHRFSSNSPAWKNANGDAPFGTINTDGTSVDFTDPVESYWQHVDYIVESAHARGIACLVNPAYLGYQGGNEGWMSAVSAASASDLQDYGEFLANRYTQSNLIWCLGGDYSGSSTERQKQWNIVTGIRKVRTTDIITAHTGPSDEAYTDWNGYSGFNLNNIYDRESSPSTWWYEYAATAYARSGPIPFILIEARYDGEGADAARCRLQAYTALLSGACGHFFGNNPIWGFGEPNYNGGNGAASALSTALSTAATVDMTHLRELFSAYAWHSLVPTTDTSLVTTSLGSGSARVCPALASDGSFALIWKPTSGAVTVDFSALEPSMVRARWFNPDDGGYTAVGTYPNTGTQEVTFPGERVLVLDSGVGYSTSFASDESPISESGRWARAANSWNDVKTVSGAAQGAAIISTGYADCYSLFQADYGSDYEIQGTVYKSSSIATGVTHEVELLLRGTDTSSTMQCYECLFDQSGTTQFVRWNGSLGDFTVLSVTSKGSLGRALRTGDVVKARIVGNAVSVWINDTLIYTATPTDYSAGKPGIGMFVRSGGNLAALTLTDLKVTKL